MVGHTFAEANMSCLRFEIAGPGSATAAGAGTATAKAKPDWVFQLSLLARATGHSHQLG